MQNTFIQPRTESCLLSLSLDEGSSDSNFNRRGSLRQATIPERLQDPQVLQNWTLGRFKFLLKSFTGFIQGVSAHYEYMLAQDRFMSIETRCLVIFRWLR